MRFRWMALFGASFVWVIAPAAAQFRMDPVEFFMRSDQDGDGRVSIEELQASRLKLFPRLDRDGDGFLTAADTPRFGGAQAEERLAKMREGADRDKDGRVSQDEFVTAPAPIFRLADANNDGIVTRAEADSLAARLPELGAPTGQ